MGLSQWSSSSFFMHAFILLWWCGLLVTSVVGGNNETDRLALLEFKAKITDDPLQVLSSWNHSIHFCQWRGVTCGRRHQRVIKLELQSSKLVGPISPHVGNLSFLKNLTLSNNRFHDEIPSEIDRLRRLQDLRLANNTISGKIPRNLSHCTNLKFISFSRNLLDGEIPPTLGTLSKLQHASFESNNLTGSIPPSFGNLSSLEKFGAMYNNLGGSIPTSFGQLTKLIVFAASTNRLSGTIPPSIFNLSSLQGFDVGFNQIQGHLPSDMGITLPNIENFNIYNNLFVGPIPISISNASNLDLLDLSINNLKGGVPSLEKLYVLSFFSIYQNELGNGGANDLSFLCSLTNSTYLTDLEIGINNFGGELPKCIANFSTTLIYLLLNNNKISGNIPTGIGDLTDLEELDIGNNKLSGHIPFEIGKLRKLRHLDLSANIFAASTNRLSGTIPPSIFNLSSLQGFDVGFNQIQGHLPSDMGITLPNIENFNIYNNLFVGPIPISISNASNLDLLDLSINNLKGGVPSLEKLYVLSFFSIYQNELGNGGANDLSFLCSLTNSTYLTDLEIGINNFGGELPKCIANFSTTLIYLLLNNNKISGNIPTGIGDLTDLEELDIGNNKLSGHIPFEIGKLRKLRHLDLSANSIFGNIPSSLGNLTILIALYLQDNNLQGSIPSSLGKCENMIQLSLAKNNLNGIISDQLLNLSYNNFEGEVPTNGVFKNISAAMIKGNSKLCGGMPKFDLPICKYNKKRKLTLSLKLIISIVSSLLGVTLVLLFLLLRTLKRKRRERILKDSGNLILNVSYQSLLKATDAFSTTNLIGVGSFGSVYRGILDHDGRRVAIKVLNLLRRGASKSFIAECEALRNIRHRNLVKVLTACSGVDYQGHDFKALVYEFMTNGNLDEWLHPISRINDVTEEQTNLNFLQRLNIAIDVANALEYLHHRCHSPIVHCDLKPSNVLLDDEMIGHVGDFGLARFLREATQECFTNQSSSIGLKGTVGYAPPGEYLFHF
nr:probable LRR receptor-like serine/threonine-protein kinase At3g47570 [Quercus suber]